MRRREVECVFYFSYILTKRSFSLNLLLQNISSPLYSSSFLGFYSGLLGVRSQFSGFNNTVEDWQAWPSSDAKIEQQCVVPQLEPGTLYLFAGQRSLHRVTEVRPQFEPGVSFLTSTPPRTRINAIFTYYTQPGEVMNDYTRLKFFGENAPTSRL